MKPVAVCVGAVAVLVCGTAAVVMNGSRKVRLPVSTAPVTFFDESRQGITLASLPRGIHSLSAEECGRCHTREHSQWQESAHARSVTEPVFTAAFHAEQRFLCRSCHSPLIEQHPTLVYRMESRPSVLLHGSEPQGDPATTAEFRAQLATQQMRAGGAFPAVTEPNPHYNATLAREGVNCVTCHVRDGTVLTTKQSARTDVPHSLTYSPMLAKADFCGGCHQFAVPNPSAHPFETTPRQGSRIVTALQRRQAREQQVRQLARLHAMMRDSVSTAALQKEDPPVPPEPGIDQQYQTEARVQDTLAEFRMSPAAMKGETCQSCHMPESGGRGQHHWPGRDDLAMLRRAVTMNARLDRESYQSGDLVQAVIKLKNDAGHRFPTGDSVHAGIVDVWLKDGGRTLGRQVFVMSNQQSGRRGFFVQQIGQSFQRQAFAIDRGGNTPVMFAGKLDAPQREDTRLLPGEEATLVYSQKVQGGLAQAKNPVLRIRVFHSGVHPAFKGSRVDPKTDTLKLIREEVLPIRIATAREVKTATRGTPALTEPG
jgi:RNase P subunit RPR2